MLSTFLGSESGDMAPFGRPGSVRVRIGSVRVRIGSVRVRIGSVRVRIGSVRVRIGCKKTYRNELSRACLCLKAC